LIASSPAGLPWDQLAGFGTGPKLSLLYVSRLTSVDVTQRPLTLYSRSILRYRNYYSSKLTNPSVRDPPLKLFLSKSFIPLVSVNAVIDTSRETL
jgi:hypothetical protein